MPKTKQPCKRCGSLERYSNRGCLPCQLKKQTLRNRAYATGKGKIYAANAKAREEARKNGASKYESVDTCLMCNTNIRYVSGGNCVTCNYNGAPDDPDNKPRKMVTA